MNFNKHLIKQIDTLNLAEPYKNDLKENIQAKDILDIFRFSFLEGFLVPDQITKDITSYLIDNAYDFSLYYSDTAGIEYRIESSRLENSQLKNIITFIVNKFNKKL